MVRHHVSDQAAPASRGEAFGAAHADRIAATVSTYERLFRTVAEGVDLEAAGIEALRAIEEFAPNLAAEIRGIAGGAALSPSRVAAINARTELLARAGVISRGECSAVVSLGRDGQAPVAGQTWDWHEELSDSWLVWTIQHPDGHRVHTLTEYGVVGKIGVTSASIGVLFTLLRHRRDGLGSIGVPVHVLSRSVLDRARDVSQALELIASARVSASTSLNVVAWRDGECTAATAELHPGGPSWVLPDEDGLLIHTNHFVARTAEGDDLETQRYPDSLTRYEILRRRLHGTRLASRDALLAALTSHVGAHGGVCCHPREDAVFGDRQTTIATVSLDVAAGSLAVRPGRPCETATWTVIG